MLDYAGEHVHDDFLTLTVLPAAGGNDPPGNDIYHRSIDALNTHYAPQVQREYEVFSFRTAKQEEGESLDQFVTRLRKLELTPETRDATTDPAKVESIIQIEKPTKVPPATTMIGREINISLPLTSHRKTTAIERRVKANDVAAKQSMKTYSDERKHTRHANITDERKHTRHANITDERTHTRHANITVGDKVRIVGRKSFSPKIHAVTRKTGSKLRAHRGQHVVTRNASFFKVVHCREEEEDETSEYVFDNVLECRHHQQHNVQHPVRDVQRPVRDRHPPPYLRVPVYLQSSVNS